MRDSTFTTWWPGTEARIRHHLSKRDPDHVDDIVQLTAERALRHSGRFEDFDHFTGWCVTVARNASTDHWRKHQREDLGAVPDQFDPNDVFDLVAARLAGATLVDAIQSLSEIEQRALTTRQQAIDRRTAHRFAMARHRARAKLRAVFEGLAAAFNRQILRLSRRLSWVSESGAAAGVAALSVVIGVEVASVDLHRRFESQGRAEASVSSNLRPSRRGAFAGDLEAGLPAQDRGLVKAPHTNHNPIPAFFIPLGSGTNNGRRQGIDARPTGPEDTNLVCVGDSPLSGQRCIARVTPSTDELFGPAFDPIGQVLGALLASPPPR